MTEFGDRLKAALKASGLTQEDVAEAAGISQGTVARISSGDTAQPMTGTWTSIAKVFGLTGDELLRGMAPRRVFDPASKRIVDRSPPPASAPTQQIASPPDALTVDRSQSDALPGEDDETPLERAISAAYDATKYTRRDFNAAADAARALYRWAKEGADPSFAKDYLDVAKAFRLEGAPFTPQDVNNRVLAKRMAPMTPAARQAKHDANEEARRLSEEIDGPSTGDKR